MTAAPLLLDKTPPPTLGAVELNSIAAGVETLDALAKESPIEILLAEASSAGKYLILVGGEVDETARALGRALEAGGDRIIDDVLLPSIHPQLAAALTLGGGDMQTRLEDLADPPAVAVVECYGGPTLLGAADCAAKTGEITVEKIHLLAGIGGKATTVFTGDVESTRVAIDSAAGFAEDRGLLAHRVLIPRPDASILPFLKR